MKLLKATKRTQGQRESDFFFAQEDEILRPGLICDRDLRLMAAGRYDDGCGCQRSMVGTVTNKGTTTFEVFVADMTEEEAVVYYDTALERAGWTGHGRAASLGAVALKEVLAAATPFEPGDVLEKRGDVFVKRELPGG